MGQYISKDALVAEIKRRKELVSDPILSGNDLMIGERNAYFNLLSFLDTLEVKEINFDKEYKEYVEEDPVYNKLVNGIVGKNIAKHFFELGLNSSVPMTWEDIRNIDHILDGMRNENQVFGYPKFYEEALRRFKAMKGE